MSKERGPEKEGGKWFQVNWDYVWIPDEEQEVQIEIVEEELAEN